jgi:hypothetical protein
MGTLYPLGEKCAQQMPWRAHYERSNQREKSEWLKCFLRYA